MSKKHQFTKSDIDAAVVFAGFDGGSYSATVVEVTRDIVRIKYFPHAPLRNRAGGFVLRPVYAVLQRADWGRLTLFPKDSKFITLEVL